MAVRPAPSSEPVILDIDRALDDRAERTRGILEENRDTRGLRRWCVEQAVKTNRLEGETIVAIAQEILIFVAKN